MKIIGMTTVRNEAWIVRDTLDLWSEVCPDGIYIYCDASTDATPALCRSHPNVKEVLESNHYWEDRAGMEPYKRQALFNSVARFLTPADWVVMFDADEHLELDSWHGECLDDLGVVAVDCRSWDMYMTAEDLLTDRRPVEYCPSEYVPGRGHHYRHRQWCSTAYRQFPFFLRFDPRWIWKFPNQHMPAWDPSRGLRLVHGSVKHWSKGHSELIYDRKAEYYRREWKGTEPGMTPSHQLGKGVRTEKPYLDDVGQPLQKWEDRQKV